MNTPTLSAFDTGVDTSAPLKTLYHAHATILAQLGALSGLPLRLGRFGQAWRVRRMAAATLALFQQEVPQHHADEEAELFPAVLRSATPGAEHERVQGLTRSLVADHRSLERAWKHLEPSFRALARGRAAEVDLEMLDRLVRGYADHARLEEQQFLPLAQSILGRDSNHLGAFGMALHLRRAPEIPGYL
jgi:hypothetical protein